MRANKFRLTIFICISVALTLCVASVCFSEFTYFCAQAEKYTATVNVVKAGQYTTSFATSGAERAHNIRLAADNFRWLKVMPGEELSFNKVVGVRSAERGYKESKVINNGEYVQGIGGGVCQVSSTLYCAWIRAGLGVKKVQAHSLPSSYCPMSQDATVSDAIDLVLVNDGDCEVYVNGYTSEGALTFDIYGKKPDYEINFTTNILKVVPAGEDITYVDKLPEGVEYVIARKPHEGYRTSLTAEYIKDGQVVSSKVLRQDFYRPIDAKILMIAD